MSVVALPDNVTDPVDDEPPSRAMPGWRRWAAMTFDVGRVGRGEQRQTVPGSGLIFSWSSTGAVGCFRARMLSISTSTEKAMAAYT